MTEIEARRVAAVHQAELEHFAREHPRSRELFERARAELSARVEALDAADLIDVGGVGGTLAGNALSMARAPPSARSSPPRRSRR